MHGPSQSTMITHFRKMLRRLASSRRRADLQRAEQASFALELMETGEYGFCLGCGLRIPELRLLTKPEATHCQRCEREQRRALST